MSEILDYLFCGFKFYRRWRGGKWYSNPHCVLGGTGPLVRRDTGSLYEDYDSKESTL